MATNYEPFARFYDLDTQEHDADLPFWINLARRTGGPILEIGAGTGRVLIPLAEAGFSVVGVDSSPSMLAVAREKISTAKLSKKISLVEADARDLQLNRRFPLAFVALNTFGHFSEPGEPERVLERLRAHLAPGALLALDLPNPTAGAFGDTNGLLFHEYTRPGPTSDSQTVKLRSQLLDEISQRINVSVMYDEVSPLGEIRRTLASFVLRYFYAHEIELLLRLAHFTVEAIYGSYELDALTDQSERMLVVARASPVEVK